MSKKLLYLGALALTIASCNDQKLGLDESTDVTMVSVESLSPEMEKVRNYVPQFATVAHRGTTFWAPEETESSFRWAREVGADYLEADLQVTKDGVILALHDDDLRRTTNIEVYYGERVPQTRKQYYIDLGYSEAEAQEKFDADTKSFMPYYTSFYTYSELLMLDAGSWFNFDNPKQARDGFVGEYISTLEDMIQISRGMKLKRNGDGSRVWSIVGRTGETVKSISGTADVVKYAFEFEADDVYSGNVPGIYLEFKQPWLNPSDFEVRVYNELDRLGMNIITAPESDSAPFYVNGKVNVGNTNGKVILQTFSTESMGRVKDTFMGKVPMCFLVWPTGNNEDPEGFASMINLAIGELAHIIGPCISGAPNNYPEMNYPWMDYLIEKAGMLNHPYSFDSKDQMQKYFGNYNFGNTSGSLFNAPYLDAMFTNRSELTIDFFINNNVRDAAAPTTVPNCNELLDALGY